MSAAPHFLTRIYAKTFYSIGSRRLPATSATKGFTL
jgi:hypothetical protein